MKDISRLLSTISASVGWTIQPADLLVLRNMGVVRPFAPNCDVMEARGFHLLLLDAGGRQTHYLKCAHVTNSSAIREGTLLTSLAGAAHVPPAKVIDVPDLTVVLLEIVPGPSFASRVSAAPLTNAISEARTCLSVRNHIVAIASERGLLNPPEGVWSPRQALEPSLHSLQKHGVRSDVTTAIRARMPDAMPPSAQHGDFSPPNIIWGRSGPVVLDFESFGLVSCPLYDTWHFIRRVREARGDPNAWTGTLNPTGKTDFAWRSLLDEEVGRLSLTPEQVAGSALWYLTHFTNLILSRGVPRKFCQTYLEDLTRAACAG